VVVLLPPTKSPHERYDPAQVIQAIKTARGLIVAAAEILQCDRGVIYDYRDRHPEVRAALTKANELQLDTAELQLFSAIDRGEAWSICFFLKTRGRHRGYVERHEVKIGRSLEDIVLASMGKKAEP
jgi:hypothetical protein